MNNLFKKYSNDCYNEYNNDISFHRNKRISNIIELKNNNDNTSKCCNISF